MTIVWVDRECSDDERRQALFRGELFLYSPTRASTELVEFTREYLSEAFGGRNPRTAQFELPVEEYAAILAEAKPRYIHHERHKSLLRELLQELGCDPAKTYFDVPRLRTSTSNDYLTTGIAYAFHPHRDTWYSAPMCQINWWMPVFELSPENPMAFHPQYWDRPVPNSSQIYDYQEWNKRSRFAAATQIGKDDRPQPRPVEPVDVAHDVRLLPKPGGIIVFSAAQLHSSVPNTSSETRISIDFRTVHVEDVEALSGAPNVDSNCTGSTMADYLRVEDLSRLPERLAAPYADGPPQRSRLARRA